MKEYTVNEFIELTESEPLKWINYCEIIVLYNGKIILARPSHIQAIIEYCLDIDGESEEELHRLIKEEYISPLDYYIDKYKLISLWYNNGICSGNQMMNRFQRHTIDKLQKKGLLSKSITFNLTYEYTNYLKRKELK